MKLEAPTRRMHVALTDRQYAILLAEAEVSGLSMAELIRRAVDRMYRPGGRPTIRGLMVQFSLWTRPDAALAGRRPRVRQWPLRLAADDSPRLVKRVERYLVR
jgi:hypothetical protein